MLNRLVSLTIVICLVLSCTAIAFAETYFSKASDWAKPELDEAYRNGLIPTSLVGVDMTKSITREEFAEVAVKLYEKGVGKASEIPSQNPFTDTKNPEILKAYKLGITTGVTSTTFAPGKLINREQVASMLSRTIRIMIPKGDFSTAGSSGFSDQKTISSWAQEHVLYMAMLGIIKGSDGKFNPLSFTTREQAVAMSLRTFNRLDDIYDSKTENSDGGETDDNNPDEIGSGSSSAYTTPRQPLFLLDDSFEKLPGSIGKVVFRLNHLVMLGEYTGFNLYYKNDDGNPDVFSFTESGFAYEEKLGKTVDISVTCVNRTAESTPLNLKFAMIDKVKGDIMWSERQTDDLLGAPCWYGLSWTSVEGAAKYKVFVSDEISSWLRFIDTRDLTGFSSFIVDKPYFSTKEYTGLPDYLVNATWGETRYVIVLPVNDDNVMGPFPRYYKITMTGVSTKAYN